MNKDTGGPAFPTPRLEMNDEGVVTAFAVMADGMSLRDYFAAKVLVSACEDNGPKEAAELSYLYADAMLKAREQ